MRFPKPFAVGLSLSALAFAGAAGAQTKADDGAGYSYHFDDDLMVGDTFDSPPPVIKMGHRPQHIMLLRPRASFVTEMLQSVEVL
jgi:hypothetical protein